MENMNEISRMNPMKKVLLVSYIDVLKWNWLCWFHLLVRRSIAGIAAVALALFQCVAQNLAPD